ncbi:response regulator [Microvirga sp. BT325]|uniref:Response regulator n=2 Tax=Microvirga splendida TaxID=2795727 RepID=A0ABS0Y736_9HYPH|nr:response regulator [Microvirga splendida]
MPISFLWSRVPQPECRLAEASSTRVLVVEDDLPVGAVAAEALEEAGFTVLFATSAEKANAILAEEAVDVLFTDIDLGGLDGCALAQQALKAQPGIAVLLTSGRSRRCYADRLPPGAAFLAKPYRLPQLVDEVLRAVEATSSH